MGLFSEAGDPILGLLLPMGDSGARRGVMASSDDRVRLCRCAEMGPSFGMGSSAQKVSTDVGLVCRGVREYIGHGARLYVQ